MTFPKLAIAYAVKTAIALAMVPGVVQANNAKAKLYQEFDYWRVYSDPALGLVQDIHGGCFMQARYGDTDIRFAITKTANGVNHYAMLLETPIARSNPAPQPWLWYVGFDNAVPVSVWQADTMYRTDGLPMLWFDNNSDMIRHALLAGTAIHINGYGVKIINGTMGDAAEAAKAMLACQYEMDNVTPPARVR